MRKVNLGGILNYLCAQMCIHMILHVLVGACVLENV